MNTKALLSDHHGDLLENRSVANLVLTRVRYSPSAKLPLHIHRLACFCIVLNGSYDETYGSHSVACNSGTVLFRPQYEPHSDSIGGAGATCLLVEVAPPWLDRVRACGVKLDQPTKQDGKAGATLGLSLLRHLQQMGDAAPLAIEGLALELAAEFVHRMRRAKTLTPPRWLRHARELLDASYAYPMTLPEIGKAVNIHPVHLAREFRRYFGCTVAGYVRQQRVEHACRALRSSDQPLVQVAVESGFSHQAHFTRVFSKQTGMTPGVYRKATRSR